MLDGCSAEFSFSGTSVPAYFWDTKLPLNVNDSDLNLNMRELPVENPGLTEMLFCLLRYEIDKFLRECSPQNTFDGSSQMLSNPAISIADKDNAIDALERLLEQKFLRHCDPSIPLHFLSLMVAKFSICMMRLQSHHPRQNSDGGMRISQEEKTLLFSNSVKAMEYENLIHSNSGTQRFLWNVAVHFQYNALIYTLSELRYRMVGVEIDRAWQQIEEFYEHHPEILTERKNALYVAIGNLTIKTWEARDVELARQHRSLQTEPPHFISKLRSLTAGINALSNPNTRPNPPLAREQHYGDAREIGDNQSGDANCSKNDVSVQSDPSTVDLNPMDWARWDKLLQDSELYAAEGRGMQMLNHI